MLYKGSWHSTNVVVCQAALGLALGFRGIERSFGQVLNEQLLVTISVRGTRKQAKEQYSAFGNYK